MNAALLRPFGFATTVLRPCKGHERHTTAYGSCLTISYLRSTYRGPVLSTTQTSEIGEVTCLRLRSANISSNGSREGYGSGYR